MATVPQITAAKALLTPQPYSDASVLTADSRTTLMTFLRKYLYDKKASGRYTGLADKLAAASGISAAHLQAILTNVSQAGSKKAQLTGELLYSTQETIDNELSLAISIMYEPIAYASMGTKESEMAARIRCQYHTQPCGCTELERTRGIRGVNW